MDGHFGIGIMLINPPQNFNLINVTTNDDILPTKYFYILKNSIDELHMNMTSKDS